MSNSEKLEQIVDLFKENAFEVGGKFSIKVSSLKGVNGSQIYVASTKHDIAYNIYISYYNDILHITVQELHIKYHEQSKTTIALDELIKALYYYINEANYDNGDPLLGFLDIFMDKLNLKISNIYTRDGEETIKENYILSRGHKNSVLVRTLYIKDKEDPDYVEIAEINISI